MSKRWGAAPKKTDVEPASDHPADQPPSAEASEPTSSAADSNKAAASPGGVGKAAADFFVSPTTARGVLGVAIDVRKDTISATDRILRDLENAKEIEIEALAILHKDLDKFRHMEDDLATIDGTMARARAQITALARRMVRDGCFKIMAVLLVCTIGVVVALVVTDSFGKIPTGGSGSTVVVINGGDRETTTRAP